MDPSLWELYLEGDVSDEVMAILRLHDERVLPPGVTIVARFGPIATCRLRRGDIVHVRALPQIASLKAPDPVIADAFDEGAEEIDVLPSDVRRPETLPERGNGTVVGIIDWGLDFAHPNFRNADGTTRLIALWNQQDESESAAPNRYGYGRIYERREIDLALASHDPYASLRYDPADFDPKLTGTHGTHVCDIAAGNGSVGPSGVAPEAEIVFVHLAARTGGFSNLGDSVTLLEAIDFIRASAGNRPCVINLSMGNMGGPHDGTTLVEQAIDAAVSEKPGFVICQSCGNYYQRRTHAERRIATGDVTQLRWQTDAGDRTPNELEIWYPGSDRFSVRLIAPDGTAAPSVALGEHSDFEIGGVRLARVYHRNSDPNNRDHHIHIFLYSRASAGIWTVEVRGEHVVDGRMHAWIERDEGCAQCQSQFAFEDFAAASTTNTISNGYKTIAVAAYDRHAGGFAIGRFSSAGPTRDGRLKPDLCAPGVRVLAARSRVPDDPGALLTRKSGTSMAAPHVTGTVALVFEAARRPLSIDETRNILVSTADAADIPPTVPPRTGAGRLNIEAAVAVARPTAQEKVMTTSSDKAAPCCSACGRAAAMTAENEPQEELVGQISAGNVQSVIDTDLSTGVSAGTLDDALQSLWSNIAAQPNWAITGSILGGGCNAATWTPSATLPTPPVVEVAAPTLCCVIVSGAAYFPSSVTGQVLRWVRIPRIAEFYALAAADQKAQKKRWGEAVWRARKEIAAALPGTNVTKAWIQTLSSPTLRLLIAQFADQALPVKRIDNAAKKQRGGLVNGVTNPILLYPLTEPDCYLRVIAGAEGKMEAVNTWDRGAGVSLGPIQFNAIEGHLFNFIGRLRDLDPDLYAQQLGWTVAPDSGHYNVTIAGTMLHGDAAHASDNAGFLQSGVVGNGTFAQIDATIRRDFALRFRNVVVWPHVQELIYLGCSDYLANGLAKIAQPANGIPVFDPANPSRELFILKALLLSAYVRFSSCLDPLLVALRRWTTVADKLAHILDAIDAMTSCTSHRAALRTRLAGQLKTAKEVWKVIKRLRGDTSSESVAEPEWEWDESDGEDEPIELESWHEPAEWDEAEPLLEDFGEAWDELTPCGESDEAAEDVELTPQETFARLSVFSPAELFDAFFTRSAAQTKFAPLVEVIAEPGETMPELSPGHVVVTRALGEGSLARMSVVARTEETPQGGGWSEAIESAGGTAVARPFGNGARVPANQMIFRLRSAEDISEKDDDAAAISCDGGVSLHADLVTAIRETRRLSGESLQLVKPPCAATKICPTAHRGYHPTGDATHFANLSEEGLRIAEIAGIWGTDLPALKKAKASRQVTTPNPYAPLSGFGAVAIRKDGKRELHVHRGAPVIESYVDCARWKNLANEHALGSIYTLMKRNWFERSIHRQWGTEAAIQWIGNLCRFYKDQTGLMLGIGDISFIVGGKMDDHESHKHGLDVDVYVLEYPAGTPFPEAYWCEGEKTLSLSAMTPPAATGPKARYPEKAGTALGTREPVIWQRYATVLAFCLATWNNIEAFVWHGARQLEKDGTAIATAALGSWNTSYWGASQAPLPAKPASKLVGIGHGAYQKPKGWPLHRDHVHVRLTFC